jgi:hypothetical protein
VIPQVWTVRGGKVVRVRAYREEAEPLEAAIAFWVLVARDFADRETALEAAGLSE